MNHVEIISTGSYLPGEALTNQDLERLVGALSPEILQQIQVEQRHWLIDPETGEHRVANSEMAAGAARQALELAGISAEEVEFLLVSTSSPDYPLPALVTLVQDQLGLQRCATLEVRSGCAGTVAALDVARLYLERGIYRTAVVIGCEAISPLLAPSFLGQEPARIRVRERLNLYAFGDGAAAVVLKAVPAEHATGGVLGSVMACAGGGRKPGMLVPLGGTRSPLTELQRQRLELRVDFTASSQLTPHLLTEALQLLLEQCGLPARAVDLCIIPEGNTRYLRDELEREGLLTTTWQALEGRIFENLSLVGNTGSAALPLALDYAWKTGRLRMGDRLLLLALESSKWLYAGMGLIWSARPYQQVQECGAYAG